MNRILRRVPAGFRVSATGALALLLTSSLAWAQATAQLNGRVTDESAAALPGATITVTQTDTAFTRTVVTDESGTYVLPNLPIGPYRLEVSLQGFRSYIQTGLVLQVDASPTIWKPVIVIPGRPPDLLLMLTPGMPTAVAVSNAFPSDSMYWFQRIAPSRTSFTVDAPMTLV